MWHWITVTILSIALAIEVVAAYFAQQRLVAEASERPPRPSGEARNTWLYNLFMRVHYSGMWTDGLYMDGDVLASFLRGVSRLSVVALGLARFAGGQPVLWFA